MVSFSALPGKTFSSIFRPSRKMGIAHSMRAKRWSSICWKVPRASRPRTLSACKQLQETTIGTLSASPERVFNSRQDFLPINLYVLSFRTALAVRNLLPLVFSQLVRASRNAALLDLQRHQVSVGFSAGSVVDRDGAAFPIARELVGADHGDGFVVLGAEFQSLLAGDNS